MISVIIPCHNQARFLQSAVDSVLVQTYDDFEIVIVDDASTDGTAELAKQIQEDNPGRRIRLVVRKTQGGLSEARNCGIERCEGDPILPLDADDLLAPLYLEKIIDAFVQDLAIDIVHADRYQFGIARRTVRLGPCQPDLLLLVNQLGYCSAFRRHVWAQIGGYPDNWPIQGYEDWEFWIAAATRRFNFRYIPEVLWYYRVRLGNMASSALQNDEYLRARIIWRHYKFYDPAIVDYARKTLALGPAKGPKP